MLQFLGAGEQHDPEAAGGVEGDGGVRGKMEDHMIMRAGCGARMMKTAGLFLFALLHREGARHAEVQEQPLAVVEKGEQVFRPPREPVDAPATQPRSKTR